MDKLMITCAVSGAETTREDNPALPITPEEIAASACEACEAGAAIIHLHVRDKDGGPTQDAAVFKEAIELIRAGSDAVIEVTTGGAVGMTLEERLQPLALDPEMASLDCGSVNFGDDYLVNALPDMRKAAQIMQDKKIQPTLECFDLSHIDASTILLKEGLIRGPLHYGLVLNVPAGVKYGADTLGFFVRRLPADSRFTLIAIGGRICSEKIYGALAYHGHIRVGFEDNVYYSKGVLAASNAELVERAVRIAAELGREPATPDDVRKNLHLRRS